MKFLLLKTLLLRRAKDEGFTLPIVIAIGLMMILLSAVNLARSSEENLNTLSQQGLSNAIAMAEAGVVRYRELLDKNRVLAVYNLSEWTTENFVTSQVCDAISNTDGGWADNTSDTWRDITEDIDNDSTDETIGYYKIVDYIYDNDNNTSTSNNGDIDITDDDNNNSRGLLTIKGRSLDGSEAQIQVEIPIGSNAGEDIDGDGVPDEGDMDGLRPAIWIRNNNKNLSSIGEDLTVNGGNIVLSVHSNGSDDACVAPEQDVDGNDLTPYTAAGKLRIDPRQLPDRLDFASLTPSGSLTVPKLITGDINFNTTIKPIFEDNIPTALYLGGREQNSTGNETAPRISNELFDKGDEQIYYYKVDGDLVIDGNQKLVVPSDGRVRVILEVAGNVNISDNAAIITQSDLNLVDGSLKSDPDTGNITLDSYSRSRYLEIHAGGDVDISGSGNVYIKAFIYANGTVNISDSVNVNIFGSVWAQDWNNTSTGAVVVNADDYKFYSISDNRTPRPITYRIEDWERQDVN